MKLVCHLVANNKRQFRAIVSGAADTVSVFYESGWFSSRRAAQLRAVAVAEDFAEALAAYHDIEEVDDRT